MKYTKELQQKKLFSLADVTALTKNKLTARSLLQNYKKAGYITSVRRDMYAALDLASSNVLANRFEIASQASESAYVSYHSALEFHGIANQVFYEVSISSGSRIGAFTFDGITYNSYRSSFSDGVIKAPYNNLIKVTNVERTVVDCLHNTALAGGVEELMQCILLIPLLNEELVLEYLKLYDEKYLWQKAGCILEMFASRLGLTESFFDECGQNIGKRKNYLEEGSSMSYSSRWRLYIPENILSFLNNGGEDIV